MMQHHHSDNGTKDGDLGYTKHSVVSVFQCDSARWTTEKGSVDVFPLLVFSLHYSTWCFLQTPLPTSWIYREESFSALQKTEVPWFLNLFWALGMYIKIFPCKWLAILNQTIFLSNPTPAGDMQRWKHGAEPQRSDPQWLLCPWDNQLMKHLYQWGKDVSCHLIFSSPSEVYRNAPD